MSQPDGNNKLLIELLSNSAPQTSRINPASTGLTPQQIVAIGKQQAETRRMEHAVKRMNAEIMRMGRMQEDKDEEQNPGQGEGSQNEKSKQTENEEISDLKQQLKQQKMDHADTCGHLNDLHKDFDEKEESLKNNDYKLQRLEIKLEEVTEDLIGYKLQNSKELKILKAQIGSKDIAVENEKLKKELAELYLEKKEKDQRIHELEDEAKGRDFQTRLDCFKAEIQKKDQKIKDLNGEIENFNVEQGKILENIESTNEKLRQNTWDLKKQHSEEMRSKDQKIKELENQLAERNARDQKIKYLEEEMESKDQMIEYLEGELEPKDQRIKSLEHLSTGFDRLEKELKAKYYEESQDLRRQLQKEVEAKDQKIKNLENTNQERNKTLEKLRFDIWQLKKDHSIEMEQVQMKIFEKTEKTTNSHLQRKFENLMCTYEKLRVYIKDLKKRHSDEIQRLQKLLIADVETKGKSLQRELEEEIEKKEARRSKF